MRCSGVAAVGVVIALLVIPQVRTGLQYLGLIGQLQPAWVVAGVVLEMLSFLAYGLFTRSVLPAEGRPAWHWLLRVDVFGAGLTHVLPGGGAAASALRYRMLRQGGVASTDAAFGSTVQGLGSALVINLLLLVGVLCVLPSTGSNPLYLTGALVGGGLLAISALLCTAVTAGSEATGRLARRVGGRIGRADRFGDAVARSGVRLRELAADPALVARATAWAAANWIFDAASLWVFLAAFGHRVALAPILVAFSLANTLAIIPVTPGGLGIIEGILIPSLIGFGTPKGIAVLGVLVWRLWNFWAPIPVGGLSWLSLQIGRRRSAAGSRTSG